MSPYILLGLPLIFAEFTSLPENPQIGESVILKCRLNAPSGMKFAHTDPQLTTNLIENYFSFHEITETLQDLRYNAMHQPDENRMNLVGDITILFLTASDLQIQFTCLAQLENDTYIRLTLTLNTTHNAFTTSTSFPHTSVIEPSTRPPTDKDSSEGWKIATAILAVLVFILFVILLLAIFIGILQCRNNALRYKPSHTQDSLQMTSKEDPTLAQPVTDPLNLGQEENANQGSDVTQTSL